MAGDVPADERVFIATDAGTPGPAALARSSGAPRATGEDPTASVLGPGEQTLHRYGRVHVLGAPAAADGRESAIAPNDGAVVAVSGLASGLDRVETLGLEAFRLRASAAYRLAKQRRARDGEYWDMGGACVDTVPPPGASSPSAALRADGTPASAPTDAHAAPLSTFLEGSVAVGLVLVEGPSADLQFTAAERTKVVAEAQNGLSWLAAANPAADITFSWDIQIVRLGTPANPGAADLEAQWRNPALAKLGYQANFDGVYDYANAIRSRLNTRWGYVAFMTKYPVPYFAYAAIGGPRVVLTYANDGWGPDNLDRVIAHESSHIFGAVDEYASSGCDCGGAHGRFRVPNGNCDACAPNPADCLMRGNTYAFCRFTPAHVGWGRGARGNPALVQAKGLGRLGNFQLVVPSSFDGLTHREENFDQPGYPWEEPWQTAQALGPLDAVSMIQSTLSSPGSLETVVRAGSDLYFLWRDSTGAFAWSNPTRIATDAAGFHSLVQSRYGSRGNFEMLFPAAGGGLMHMWRNNSAAGFPWSTPRQVYPALGRADAVTLIQGSLGGGPGSLEAVVRVGTRLAHLWRDQTAAAAWHLSVWFGDGAAGNPVLIESVFGATRNFELVVPSATTGLVHYYRNNSALGTPWSGPRPFAQSLGKVDAVALTQSSFQGHLEVVARVGDRLYQMFRDASGAWFPASRIA